jgi:hypothetical protein
MDNTILALTKIGFTSEEAEKQIKDLTDIILSLVAKKLLGENADPAQSEEVLKQQIESRYTKDEIRKVSEEVSAETVKGYFDTILGDLSDEQKSAFMQEVQKDIQKQD